MDKKVLKYAKKKTKISFEFTVRQITHGIIREGISLDPLSFITEMKKDIFQ